MPVCVATDIHTGSGESPDASASCAGADQARGPFLQYLLLVITS